WDAITGALLFSVDGDRMNFSFHPREDLVVTGDFSGNVRFWSLPGGKVLKEIKAYEDAPYAPQGAWTETHYSPTGRQLATIRNGVLRVWDGGTYRMRFSRQAHPRGGTLRWSPDGRRFVTFDPTDVPKLWDAEDGRLIASLQADVGATNQFKLS